MKRISSRRSPPRRSRLRPQARSRSRMPQPCPRTVTRSRPSPAAASGAWSRRSTSWTACSAPSRATPAAARSTRPTRRSRPAAPAMPRWCRSPTTRPRSATSSCSRCSGATSIRSMPAASSATAATQYRTGIFVHDEEQRRLAEESKQALDRSKRFDQPIVTEVVDAGAVLSGRGLPPGLLPEESGPLQVLPLELRPRPAPGRALGRRGDALSRACPPIPGDQQSSCHVARSIGFACSPCRRPFRSSPHGVRKSGAWRCVPRQSPWWARGLFLQAVHCSHETPRAPDCWGGGRTESQGRMDHRTRRQ